VSGNGKLASASAPAITEDLRSRLLGKSVFITLRIVAEEFTHFQVNDHTVTQNGKIAEGSYVSAMYLFALISTIRADSFL
jgi:hypothetical protein